VTSTFAPTVALGKRRCEAEDSEPHGDGGPVVVVDTHGMPPQKRARGGDGVLKTARSTTRTRHKPVARIPISRINGKPKEAGRGAERLATPNAQGIYHQPLLGPSFQQGRADQTLDGELIWVEGRVGAEVMHHISSTVQQQQNKRKRKRWSSSRSQENSRRCTRHSSWPRKSTWHVVWSKP
jgi:hypothetical protein